MSFQVAIIGGGWYGCHIASSLLALGFSVELFEQSDRLLSEASGNNQFRLHLGFHYARHHNTRLQSRDGYFRFMERYSDLSKAVLQNVYAVPQTDSLIDFQTYRMIMTSTGLDFREGESVPIEISNIEGFLFAPERVLLIEKAREYFRKQLEGHLNLSSKVKEIKDLGEHVTVNGRRFDFVIDATWGHFSSPGMDVFYEPTMLLYFEGPADFPAITLVDGPLCSIYPTEEPEIFTLSSVPHTPLGRYATAGEARRGRDSVTNEVVIEKVEQMTRQVSQYVPEFRDGFRFMGPQLSIKTKPIGAYDDRSCHVWKRGRIFSVLSGKIDTVFFAVERILSFLEAGNDLRAPEVPSSLRGDILRQRAVIGL
ncbi:FAD-dependent oxidoreductase [Rhizobium terrae]|uniref:FAD-dependent oxidoreductase n=1 Tax=Rhizobium terrae TaxID=2171756 RepID=UPI0013C32452|nr:FAD-dependent oxidoreductase [Rhizobium terrae]